MLRFRCFQIFFWGRYKVWFSFKNIIHGCIKVPYRDQIINLDDPKSLKTNCILILKTLRQERGFTLFRSCDSKAVYKNIKKKNISLYRKITFLFIKSLWPWTSMFPKHQDQGAVAMTYDVPFTYSFSHLFVARFKANRV